MNIQSLYVYPPIQSETWPFYLDKQSYSEKGETFRAHWHEHFELIFVEKGLIGLTCNGIQIRAGKGDLLVLNPQDVHHIHSLTEQVDYYCLVFDLSLLKTSNPDLGNLEYLVPLLNGNLVFDNKVSMNADLVACYQGLVKEHLQGGAATQLMIKAYLNQLLALLIRSRCFKQRHSLRNSSGRNQMALIQQVLQYLNDNYNQDINLPELAQRFSISQYHLAHVFKTYTNRTIVQYLNRVRIEKALDLMETGDESLTDIAFKVGFNDANYFSRTFKKLMGTSPRRWMAEQRQ